VRVFSDTFTLAAEPQAIVARLIETEDHFAHIREAQPALAVLFSQRELRLHGARANAIIGMPKVQGPYRDLFEFMLASLAAPLLAWEEIELLVLVDAAIWQSLDAERRERLLFHELSHVVAKEDEFGVIRRNKDTGKPLLKLVPHDVEAFHTEIIKYGPDVCDLETACEAIVEGAAHAKRRRFKVVSKAS
jgi:hypothetical protein